jgi:tetratricopeptide (TPR) repeat protein
MECRRTIWLGLCCLGGVLGCHHESTNPLQSANVTAQQTTRKAPDGTVIHTEPDPPKRPPTAATCSTYGDWYSQAAREPGIGQAQAQQLRDTALKAYQQAMQIDPKYLPAYRSTAALYWDLNDPSHAAQMYQKALQIYPKDARLWYELGLGQFRQKEYAEGLTAMEKAHTLESENREYSNAYGYALARAGRYDQALIVFARHNDPARAHYNLARMLAHMGQAEQSMEQVRLALNQDPSLNEARQLEAELQGRPWPATEEIRPAGGPQATPAQPVQPVIFLDSAVPVESANPTTATPQVPPPPMLYGQPASR